MDRIGNPTTISPPSSSSPPPVLSLSTNPACLVSNLENALQQRSTAYQYIKNQVASSRILTLPFLLECLEADLNSASPSIAASSLLLDAYACTPTPSTVTTAASTTTIKPPSLFLSYIQSNQYRLAAKLATTTSLSTSHFTPPQLSLITDVITSLLDTSPAHAITLLTQLPLLATHFNQEAVLESLVSTGRESTATKWAAHPSFTHLQPLLVDRCMKHDRMRAANKAVKQFNLHSQYPNVEALYRKKTVQRLVDRGLFGVAAAFIKPGDEGEGGGEVELQEMVLSAMLLSGEASMAMEYSQLWGLECSVDESVLEAEKERKRGMYFQVPAYLNVHFVDEESGLEWMVSEMKREVMQHIDGGGGDGGLGGGGGTTDTYTVRHHPPAVLGVDVEWKPEEGNSKNTRRHNSGDEQIVPPLETETVIFPSSSSSLDTVVPIPSTKSSFSPASLLQLSTDTNAYVLDLLKLGTSCPAALNASLQPLFMAPHIYKLGCSISGDLKKLASSYPDVAAFKSVAGCIDLTTLWTGRHALPGEKWVPSAYKKRASGVSLSALMEATVGKPLDKGMQVSDWSRRPLSRAQLEYAALDAHASVLCFRGLGEIYHPFSTRQGLESHVFTYDNSSSAGGGRGGGEGSNSGRRNGRGGHIDKSMSVRRGMWRRPALVGNIAAFLRVW